MPKPPIPPSPRPPSALERRGEPGPPVEIDSGAAEVGGGGGGSAVPSIASTFRLAPIAADGGWGNELTEGGESAGGHSGK